jgi:hypothetical protein
MFFHYHADLHGNLVGAGTKFYWSKIIQYELTAINAV